MIMKEQLFIMKAIKNNNMITININTVKNILKLAKYKIKKNKKRIKFQVYSSPFPILMPYNIKISSRLNFSYL